MITTSDLLAERGTLAAVAQWPERIPLRSAVCIARKDRWSAATGPLRSAADTAVPA